MSEEITIKKAICYSILVTVVIISIIFGCNVLMKSYKIWSYSQDGKAELAKAEWNRQIAIREAYAEKDAAVALADAEIERARGLAKANEIIGKSLKENKEYLKYLWIQNLKNEKNQVIYIPTEANLPILEANRIENKK